MAGEKKKLRTKSGGIHTTARSLLSLYERQPSVTAGAMADGAPGNTPYVFRLLAHAAGTAPRRAQAPEQTWHWPHGSVVVPTNEGVGGMGWLARAGMKATCDVLEAGSRGAFRISVRSRFVPQKLTLSGLGWIRPGR